MNFIFVLIAKITRDFLFVGIREIRYTLFLCIRIYRFYFNFIIIIIITNLNISITRNNTN